MLTCTIRDDVGECLGIIVLKPRRFSRGRSGWQGRGQVEVEGKRCQCQAQVVVNVSAPVSTNDDCDVDAILRDSAQVDAMLEDMVRNSAQAQREALDVIAALDADVDAALRQLRDS